MSVAWRPGKDTGLLACGHEARTGQLRPGQWITCPQCQGQREVVRAEAERGESEP